ncbi:MAG: biotin--[acetyl-CoA-carboxylase] ligase [Phycisphaera sp.]|nr:biotin--[acetyl-CoA-carboxylase] ligase [Phycisphaera sp.]
MEEELADWADRLEEVASSLQGFDSRKVRVFGACGSTQDPARDLGVGSIVAAGRQTSGRGRLGRKWLSDPGEGIAISLGLPMASPDQACVAAAIASMRAVRGALAGHGISRAVQERVALKFPNDLVDRATGRKLGGILVEVSDGVAIVGIGINVHAREWPAAIPAISIEELIGSPPPARIAIMERLPVTLERTWSEGAMDLDRAFAAAHAPTGGGVEIGIGEDEDAPDVLRGVLIRLSPRRHLVVGIDDQEVEIPVDRARILSWIPEDLRSSGT